MKGILVVLMGLLQVADFLTTILAIQHGAVEVNPLLYGPNGLDIVRLLLFKLVALVICIVLVMRTSKVRPELQNRRVFLYAALYAVIVWSNWSLI
jgi:hypothetical protein